MIEISDLENIRECLLAGCLAASDRTYFDRLFRNFRMIRHCRRVRTNRCVGELESLHGGDINPVRNRQLLGHLRIFQCVSLCRRRRLAILRERTHAHGQDHCACEDHGQNLLSQSCHFFVPPVLKGSCYLYIKPLPVEGVG